MNPKIFLPLALICLLISNAFSHDWTYQYVAFKPGNPPTAQPFYLWIPPNSNKVMGILLTARGRLSQISGDSTVRKACTEANIAILGCFGNAFDGGWSPADSSILNQALANFAQQSNLPEIRYAPLASYGTSVGGNFSFNIGKAMPSRFFGIIEDNAIDRGTAAKDIQGEFLNVPILTSRGYNEPVGDPWQISRDTMLTYRKRGMASALLLRAGMGHFSYTKWEAQYFAMWLKKALTARLPLTNHPPRRGYYKLRPIDQTTGWLTDTSYKSSNIAIAQYNQYQGDKENAFWHFDEELATLWVSMHQGSWNLPNQNLSLNPIFNACVNPYNPWQTCNFNPEAVVGRVPFLPMQGTSSSGLPVRYASYNGAFKTSPKGDTAFLSAATLDQMIAMNLLLNPAGSSTQITGWIVAIQEGGQTHQGIERAIRFNARRNNASPNTQTITAVPIPDKTDTSLAFSFSASASSGLPVEAKIECGPATIEGGKIKIEPFAYGLNGKKALVILRYSQGGDATFKSANSVVDSFFVQMVSFKDTTITKSNYVVPKTKPIQLFPNPGKCNEKVNINSSANIQVIEIFDAFGKKVDTYEFDASMKEIHINQMKAGLYIVKCMDFSGQVHVEKLLLKD